MELIKNALSGFITGIVLLVLIVYIFRKQVDKKNRND